MFNIGVKVPDRYLGKDFDAINKRIVLDYYSAKTHSERSNLVLIFIKVNEACIIHALYNIFQHDPDWLLASVFLHLSKRFWKLHPSKIGSRNPIHSIKWVYADVKQDLGYEFNHGLSKRKPWGLSGCKPWSHREGYCGSFDAMEIEVADIDIDLAYIHGMESQLTPVGLLEAEIPAGKT